MAKKEKRPLRDYEGPISATKQVKEILPGIFRKIKKKHLQSPEEILKSWPGMVGAKVASMSRAISLFEGILMVEVDSSSLLNLLHQYEKDRLLRKLQDKFSKNAVRDILFRIGKG